MNTATFGQQHTPVIIVSTRLDGAIASGRTSFCGADANIEGPHRLRIFNNTLRSSDASESYLARPSEYRRENYTGPMELYRPKPTSPSIWRNEMAGRPKTTLKRLNELTQRAEDYGNDLFNLAPTQYLENSDHDDATGVAWRRAADAAVQTCRCR